eukprot:COSAG01_NODE_42335_length_441_cov_0.748538_1_plen_121_part_01
MCQVWVSSFCWFVHSSLASEGGMTSSCTPYDQPSHGGISASAAVVGTIAMAFCIPGHRSCQHHSFDIPVYSCFCTSVSAAWLGFRCCFFFFFLHASLQCQSTRRQAVGGCEIHAPGGGLLF